MKKIITLAFIACLLGWMQQAQAATGLTIDMTWGYYDVDLSQDANTGVYTVVTKGGDPYFFTTPLQADLSDDADTLSFEYKASADVAFLQMFYCDPLSEARSETCSVFHKTDEWTKVEINISAARKNFDWGYAGNKIRFDPGASGGITLQLRNFSIDGGTKGAETVSLTTAEKNAIAQHIDAYLNASYKSRVTDVTAQTRRITIKGQCEAEAGHKYALIDVPPYVNITEVARFADELRTDIATPEDFTITLNRKVTRDNHEYDRLLSKWAIVDCTDPAKDVLVSHARYVDAVMPISSPAATPLKSKKGLGGFIMGGNVSDIDDLGITSVTVNMLLNSIMSMTNNGGVAHQYGGRTYYADAGQVNYFDQVFKYCQDRGIVTSAILLITPTGGNARYTNAMRNPEYTSGTYTMPNFYNADGIDAYAATIDFLAQRYNGGQYGRINNWIMHNEVDQAKYWTNMGTQPLMRFVDTYVRSMRLVYSIARQYDQNTHVLGSFTHGWNTLSWDADYKVKDLLDNILRLSNVEGDFNWGVATHPYPETLQLPEFWKNDTHSTYSMTTGFVTFKNLEVINEWILNPDNFYNGKQKRLLFFSEQGTNSPSYSDNYLKLQAAGACWAWKKTNRLPGIDAFQWHNWQDNRAEGGLRLGLRYYADDETHPNGKKPVWYVWQAAGTDNEDTVFDPYLSTIGITSWDEIFHPIPGGIWNGVEAVAADASTLQAFGKAGAIVASQPVSVYSLTGSLVARGSGEISVAPGIYVVKRAGMSKKVIVR